MTTELVRPPSDAVPTSDAAAFTHEDVQRINRRLAWQRAKHAGFRVHRASFRCPWPISRRAYEQIRNEAVNKWLSDMEKRGWELRSKVAVDANKRTLAYDYSGDFLSVPLLDKVEIPVAALFLKRKVERVRIEVPVAN